MTKNLNSNHFWVLIYWIGFWANGIICFVADTPVSKLIAMVFSLIFGVMYAILIIRGVSND